MAPPKQSIAEASGAWPGNKAPIHLSLKAMKHQLARAPITPNDISSPWLFLALSLMVERSSVFFYFPFVCLVWISALKPHRLHRHGYFSPVDCCLIWYLVVSSRFRFYSDTHKYPHSPDPPNLLSIKAFLTLLFSVFMHLKQPLHLHLVKKN